MTSFLLQVRGGYDSAANAAEEWQFGIRLWMDQSAIDPIGTFPAIDITPIEESAATTWGHYQTNWAYTGALDMAAFMDQIADALQTFWETNKHSSDCRLLQWRLYPIDNTGHVVQLDSGAAIAMGVPTSGWVGTTSSLLPLEVACVVTFDTYKNNAKGRGRIYLPGIPANSLGTNTGRFDSTWATQMAGDAATLLGDLVNPGGAGEVGIYPVVTEPSGWNLYSQLRQVRVGEVPDSQRRRRNKLAENYHAVAMP